MSLSVMRAFPTGLKERWCGYSRAYRTQQAYSYIGETGGVIYPWLSMQELQDESYRLGATLHLHASRESAYDAWKADQALTKVQLC